MLLNSSPSLKSVPRLLLAIWVLWLVHGCGSGADPTLGQVVSVSGRVLVDGEPLQGQKGAVTFIPDTGKGNSVPVKPHGQFR